MSDTWQRLLDGEAEEWRLLLREEFGETEMQVMNITDFEVTLEDEQGYISHVHQQGDKRWKCQRCDRYRCEHVKFVIANNVQLLPRKPGKADDSEIMTF